MDYFAHGFWSYIIFNWEKKPWLAVLFGLLPDSMSFGIYFVYSIFTGFTFGKPEVHLIPDWVNALYNVSHSLVIAFLVIGAAWLIFGKPKWYMLAWPIAVIFDIPTHSLEFFPTPFLWPLNKFMFDGYSWANSGFMITNWVLIIGILTYIVWRKRTSKKNRKRKISHSK